MKKLIKRIIIVILSIIFVFGAYITYEGYRLFEVALKNKSVIEMAEGIERIPNYVTLDELPEIYLIAVITAEDRNFYSHNGVDASAIARATIRNVQTFSYGEGGSTITQQLAKNEYFTQDKRMSRKIADAFMAMRMEKELSKDEILELYVNSIYFGSGYYGIREASLGYYGKEPYELDAYEATMLAGIPNAPSAYSLDSNFRLASERQLQVLNLMVKHGVITEEEKESILEIGRRG